MEENSEKDLIVKSHSFFGPLAESSRLEGLRKVFVVSYIDIELTRIVELKAIYIKHQHLMHVIESVMSSTLIIGGQSGFL